MRSERSETSERTRPILIAHRGASAYAPEHTREAYELALRQGADFLEPDLQVTRDGHLIALHDMSLERTTNVREVFPDRWREVMEEDGPTRRWYAVDFTLEEIRSLDAGSWFGPEFAGARVPTFEEVVEIARGRAGVIPETKAPEVYGAEGHDMERLLVDDLVRLGLARPGADPETPVILQSFSDESLRKLRHELGLELPSTFLLSGARAERWLTPEGLAAVRGFATGISPDKALLVGRPELVAMAHEAGLDVIPWTFGPGATPPFESLELEMAHFLFELGVDGLFTNNPDLFPRTPLPAR
ncbi:MAG TPA: glycerophosphodiester phosphodiesterase family protein [Longimicrobiales bacterium]|nr:glycerophosphodiester phosphodiesterase family protein [Longimicrobiales bacterium]